MTEDKWAERRARRARLDALLQAAPVVVIEGVVGPGGVSGGNGRGQESWSLRMTLPVWRLAGGSMQSASLTLRRQVDDATLKACQLAARSYSAVRMRARLVIDADAGGPEAWLEDVPVVAEDAELIEQAARLQLPVIYEDRLFGTCSLDKRLDWFEATAEWNERKVSVYLQAPTLDALPAVLDQAHALWQEAAKWQARVLDRAIADLLDLKNGAWLQGDEEPVTADEFARRISLQSITIAESGAFDFCFADGELFWGHAILVYGTLAAGPTAANIAG